MQICKSNPTFTRLSCAFVEYIKTLDIINTLKSNTTIKIYKELFKEEEYHLFPLLYRIFVSNVCNVSVPNVFKLI